MSEATAGIVGGWADGLITINQPLETLRRVVGSFREAGGDGKPVAIQVHLSWDRDEDTALAIAHDQWRSNVFGTTLAWDLERPAQFDDAARFVEPEDLRTSVIVSSDLGYHIDRLGELADLGADMLFLHHVGQEQEAFIEAFGEKVLPEVAP